AGSDVEGDVLEASSSSAYAPETQPTHFDHNGPADSLAGAGWTDQSRKRDLQAMLDIRLLSTCVRTGPSVGDTTVTANHYRPRRAAEIIFSQCLGIHSRVDLERQLMLFEEFNNVGCR